jgi:hypothetical protein
LCSFSEYQGVKDTLLLKPTDGRDNLLARLTALFGYIYIKLESLTRLYIFSFDGVPAMQVFNLNPVFAGDGR